MPIQVTLDELILVIGEQTVTIARLEREHRQLTLERDHLATQVASAGQEVDTAPDMVNPDAAQEPS